MRSLCEERVVFLVFADDVNYARQLLSPLQSPALVYLQDLDGWKALGGRRTKIRRRKRRRKREKKKKKKKKEEKKGEKRKRKKKEEKQHACVLEKKKSGEKKQMFPGDVGELQLMSICDRHILANSTFSWWAAHIATARRAARARGQATATATATTSTTTSATPSACPVGQSSSSLGSTVVAPLRWFGPNGPSAEDLLPKDWTLL